VGEAIGRSPTVAVGVALSAMPVAAMVLTLIAPRARSNGFAIVAGWVRGIVVAGAILLALAARPPQATTASRRPGSPG
jgi:hypothetical protein